MLLMIFAYRWCNIKKRSCLAQYVVQSIEFESVAMETHQSLSPHCCLHPAGQVLQTAKRLEYAKVN